MLCASDVPISEIEAGEWFEILMGCVVSINHRYQILYAVQGNTQSEPYLLVQDKAQSVGVNESLYAEGALVDGELANKYDIDLYILPVEVKVCILFIVLAVMEYGIFCYCSPRSSNR